MEGHHNSMIVFVVLRFAMAFIMLWAFFDKLLGLGLSTAPEKAWIRGSSPTEGFLKFGATNPMFQSLAGSPLVDWVFMAGLLLIGLALLFGVGVRIAGYSGAVMMFLMWAAVLPLKNNPILDDHLVYLIIFIGFTLMPVGEVLGLGKWWAQTTLVKRFPLLQ